VEQAAGRRGQRHPGVGNHFAALGEWDEQLMDRPNEVDRPVSPYAPADEHADFGSHAIFDDNAHGARTTSFLRTLPRAARIFATAVLANARDRAATAAR